MLKDSHPHFPIYFFPEFLIEELFWLCLYSLLTYQIHLRFSLSVVVAGGVGQWVFAILHH